MMLNEFWVKLEKRSFSVKQRQQRCRWLMLRKC